MFDKLHDFVDWVTLGLFLGLHKPTLDEIEQKQRGNTKMDMLAKWLEKADKVESKGGPTWRQLISALEKINNKALADKIRKTLEK